MRRILHKHLETLSLSDKRRLLRLLREAKASANPPAFLRVRGVSSPGLEQKVLGVTVEVDDI